MSTSIYLVCTDHDPPIKAHDESGQHLYDLPQLRRDIAAREELVRLWIETNEHAHVDPDLGYFRNHTVRFFLDHPKCNLKIIDEYGDEHDTALSESDRLPEWIAP